MITQKRRDKNCYIKNTFLILEMGWWWWCGCMCCVFEHTEIDTSILNVYDSTLININITGNTHTNYRNTMVPTLVAGGVHKNWILCFSVLLL